MIDVLAANIFLDRGAESAGSITSKTQDTVKGSSGNTLLYQSPNFEIWSLFEY